MFEKYFSMAKMYDVIDDLMILSFLLFLTFEFSHKIDQCQNYQDLPSSCHHFLLNRTQD